LNVVLDEPSVAEVIRERGGKVFVRTDLHRCCGGGITFLVTTSEPEPGRTYRRFDADGFELFLDAGGRVVPDELHLDVRGRRTKRIEAYWNGCLYAM
jgi:hypothetical protein